MADNVLLQTAGWDGGRYLNVRQKVKEQGCLKKEEGMIQLIYLQGYTLLGTAACFTPLPTQKHTE